MLSFNCKVSSKKINLNRLFLIVRVFYGKFNGERVIRKKVPYFFACLTRWFLLYCTIKYAVLSLVDKDSFATFVIGDFLNQEQLKVHRYIQMICVGYYSWSWVLICAYQRVNSNQTDAFWLIFLPFNYSKLRNRIFKLKNGTSSLAGISRQQFIYLQKQYRRYARLAVWCIGVSIVFMASAANSLYFLAYYEKYGKCECFWYLYIANSITIYFLAFYAYYLTMGMPLNYVYLAIFTKVRFSNVYDQLTILSQQPKSNAAAINFQLLQFHQVVVEMLKINQFWSKTFGIVYFFAMFNIFVQAQQVINGDALIFRIGFTSLCTMVYSTCILFPVYNASQVHSSIYRCKDPIDKLRLRLDLPVRLIIRLQDTHSFIQSRYAGFSCFSLFMIKKLTTISTTISFFIHLILFSNVFNRQFAE